MIKKIMKVYLDHSNITQNMHGASRNYRYVLDVSTATMPPRRRRPSYHGVRERSDDTFMAVITCANNERVCLGRFWHAYLATRAYDVAARRLDRTRAKM